MFKFIGDSISILFGISLFLIFLLGPIYLYFDKLKQKKALLNKYYKKYYYFLPKKFNTYPFDNSYCLGNHEKNKINSLSVSFNKWTEKEKLQYINYIEEFTKYEKLKTTGIILAITVSFLILMVLN